MRKFAIIVAGGKGTRMNAETPKQFLSLNGIPILMRTIRKFYQEDKSTSITVVLPVSDFNYWLELCKNHDFKIPHDLVKGGETRFQSVRNGLETISQKGYVAIHDGVRPLVDTKTIEKSFALAEVYGNAIASVPMKDSIRSISGGKNIAMDRSKFRLIQTPQTFEASLIKKAFNVVEQAVFTDDASVAEHAGHKIYLFDGTYTNIKITTPEDLKIAEALQAEN